MRRRDFINVVAGAAAAWPLSVRAQQQEQARRIGILMNIAENDPEAAVQLSALMQALKERGWILGTNIQIDYRWAAGDSQLYRKYAPELIALAPNVILVVGGTGTGELQRSDQHNSNRICGNDRPDQPWFDRSGNLVILAAIRSA